MKINLLMLPWVELAILIPLLGAVALCLSRNPQVAWRVALGCASVALGCTLMAWLALQGDIVYPYSLLRPVFGTTVFLLDQLSAPLLPLVAFLHLLTILTTAHNKMNRMSFTGHLLGEAIRLATFACLEPWPLIALLALATIQPCWEMWRRHKPTQLYVLHMGLFVALLVLGQLGVENQISGASVILLLAKYLRMY